MKVKENLHNALWQLRELEHYSPLWIDAICINQDGKEKSHQLSLMSRIYSDASWVVIWLGKEDPTTYQAIQAMEEREGSVMDSLHTQGWITKPRTGLTL